MTNNIQMGKKTKIILAISILINVMLLLMAIFFFAKGYHTRALRPYFSDYYSNKLSFFRDLPATGAGIFFVGDSLTDRCEWAELLNRCDVFNRGIDGDTTDGVLNRIGEVTARKPSKIFIMIGANDFIAGRKVPEIEGNYKKILERFRTESHVTKIYIQSNLPTLYRLVPIPRNSIRELNNRLKSLADDRNIFFIDIYSRVVDINGDLNPAYTTDGAHLNGAGYLVWREAIQRFID
jgi:lysophospholipase L1-like esterase